MADLYVAVQSARSVVNDAVADPTGASAALARLAASEAFSKVAGEAVQMRGGVAITGRVTSSFTSNALMAARICSRRRGSNCGASNPRCSNVTA